MSGMRRISRGWMLGVVAGIVSVIVLMVGASGALASTGIVFYDGADNMAVGSSPFGGDTNFTEQQANNTALGEDALTSLGQSTESQQGGDNTAVGTHALSADVNGFRNTAEGVSALAANTHGYDNTGIGDTALTNNITGTDNTAVGMAALNTYTYGIENTALGSFALYSNHNGGATPRWECRHFSRTRTAQVTQRPVTLQ
jgi:hypothetical protein